MPGDGTLVAEHIQSAREVIAALAVSDDALTICGDATRYFEPESIKDRNSFRKHVVSAIQGIAELDEQTKKDSKGAEQRFL